MEVGASDAHPLEAQAPVLDGRWRIVGMLGRGAAADVHDAVDVSDGRPVAVKVLRAVGGDAVRRFEREITALAGLEHPGIVRVLGRGRCPDGRPYLVLDRAEAGTLADAIAGGPVGPVAAAALGADLAAALAHAHARGVVHRDVKPANVLLDGAGGARLGDFGIAAVLGAETLTSTGWSLGTPAYLAPEQVRGDGVGPPADVYALGLVVLEAATGARAYPGDGLPSALARLQHPPAIAGSVPPDLAAVVRSMTADAPDARPSASAAAVDLAAVAARPDDAVAAATGPFGAPDSTAALPVATTPTTAVPVAAVGASVLADDASSGPPSHPTDVGPVRPGRRGLAVAVAFTAALVAIAAVRALAGGGETADAEVPPPASTTIATTAPTTTAPTTTAPTTTAPTTTTTATTDDDDRPGNGNGAGRGQGRDEGDD